MRFVTVLLTGAAIALPYPAFAQDGYNRLSLDVRAGLEIPTTSLGRTSVVQGEYAAFTRADPAPTLGVSLNTRLGRSYDLRLLVDQKLRSPAAGTQFCDALLPCTSEEAALDGDVRTWSVGVDVSRRLTAPGWPVEPSLVLGAGIRTSSIEWTDAAPGRDLAGEYRRSNLFFSSAVRGSRPGDRLSIFAEVGARMSRFGRERPLFIEGTVPADVGGAPKTQFDIGIVTGVSFSPGGRRGTG